MTQTLSGWLPADWLDEITPPPLATPDDFILQLNGGGFALAPKDVETLEYDEGMKQWLTPVAVGEIVSFLPFEFYGRFTLQVEDGGNLFFDRWYPEKADNFFLVDHDEYFETPAQMLDPNKFVDGKALEPGNYAVDISWWGGEVMHRLSVDVDGKPTLVKAEGAANV